MDVRTLLLTGVVGVAILVIVALLAIRALGDRTTPAAPPAVSPATEGSGPGPGRRPSPR